MKKEKKPAKDVTPNSKRSSAEFSEKKLKEWGTNSRRTSLY